jgi:hypothetical protein
MRSSSDRGSSSLGCTPLLAGPNELSGQTPDLPLVTQEEVAAVENHKLLFGIRLEMEER